MSFLDYFSCWKNKSLTVLNETRTRNATTGAFGDPVYVAAGTPVVLVGAIWNKAEAERYISEQFREEVTDIFCTDYVTTVPANARLTDGTVTWSIVTRQNVAYQDDVYLIGMKRI